MNRIQNKIQRGPKRYILAALASSLAFGSASLAVDVESLIANVQSASAEIRVAAADKAAEAGVEALLPLAELMDHENQFVVKDVQHAMMNIVHYAGRPGAEEEAKKAETALVEMLTKDSSLAVKNEALELLHFVGTEEAVDAVSDCLEEDDLFDPALRCLEEIPDDDATEEMIEALEEASVEKQKRILQSIGHKGDPEAAEDLAEYFKKAPASLKIETLDAISRLGVPVEGRFGMPAMALASETETRRLPEILLRIADTEAAAGNKEKAMTIYSSVMEGALLEHVVCGAMIGIAKLGDPETLGLFGKKMADPSAAIRAVAAETIVNWEGSDVDGMLKKRFSEASGEEQAALLRVLDQRKVEGVDQIIREAISSENLATKIAALEILGNIAGTDLEQTYIDNARSEEARVAKVARAGYLKMADRVLAEGKTDHGLKIYHQALEFIYDDETLQKALTGIAGIGSEESAPKVKDLIDRGIVPEDAARAYLTLGDAYAKAGKKDKQLAMILELIDHPNSGDAKNTALEQFKALGNDSSIFTKRQGYVNEWHLIGPFPNPNGDAYQKPYFPEEKVDLKAGGEYNGEKFEWKEMATEVIPAKISMSEYFEKNQFVTSYAYTELNAPKDMEVQIMFGSNDGCEFWINGAKVFEVNMPRGCEVDGDKVPVTLKKGKNTLLLKVLQEGGGWEYVVRVGDKDGNPIDLTQVKLLD